MADPKPKSVQPEQMPFFYRRIPQLTQPGWYSAERWREVVRKQPIALLCRERLIAYLQTTPFDIRAKNPKEADKYADDCEEYRAAFGRGEGDIDTLIELLWQDALDLPVGGNLEVLRYTGSQQSPYKGDPPEGGHVYSLVHVDGATLFPTFDRDFPMAQRVPGAVTRPVYFSKDEMRRIVLGIRPEWDMKGWGFAPPERIFLAISLLYRGDTYFASLLTDTPEAGVLDLLDMDKEDAMEWLSSTRDLLMGLDPLKVPVLYQHDKPAVWIPFGRPPSEISYTDTTHKYARITAGGYWLTLSDIGMESGAEGTLAGKIRDERRSRLTGFGMVKEKTRVFFSKILPDYLEFVWEEKDEEALYNKYRSLAIAVPAFQKAIQARIMTPQEAQQQITDDGLITVELAKPEEEEQPVLPQAAGFPGQLPPGQQGQPQQPGTQGTRESGRQGDGEQGRNGNSRRVKS